MYILGSAFIASSILQYIGLYECVRILCVDPPGLSGTSFLSMFRLEIIPISDLIEADVTLLPTVGTLIDSGASDSNPIKH